MLERFGFGDPGLRVPVELMKSVELSFKRGMLKTPNLSVDGVHEIAMTVVFEPRDEEAAALEKLSEAIQKAIDERGAGQ